MDDQWEDNFLLQRLLRRANVQNPVTAATSAEEAIDYIRFAKEAPCLVFLDIGMGGRSGFDVLTWVREQETLSEVAIVMLSGCDDSSAIRRAYELGAQSYLFKYPSTQTLADIVARAQLPAILRGEFPNFSGAAFAGRRHA